MSSQPYFRQIILLFVISGLELETESLPELLKLWPSALLGMVSILFITPLFAFVYRYLPLNTFAMIGLGVFALSPTSVSSGVVLVSQCHGNIPLSLFLTVATNILCVS
jgi:predicted Na+-dependent transporter